MRRSSGSWFDKPRLSSYQSSKYVLYENLNSTVFPVFATMYMKVLYVWFPACSDVTNLSYRPLATLGPRTLDIKSLNVADNGKCINVFYFHTGIKQNAIIVELMQFLIQLENLIFSLEFRG